MKKRILSIALALLMVVGTLPTAALAVEPASADIKVAEVNGTQYTDLQTAINAANAGGTVTLLRDITTTAHILINKNLTLNLGNYTITGDTNDAVLCVYSPSDDTTIGVTINATTGGIVNIGIGCAIDSGKDIQGGDDKERTNLTINGGNYETSGTDCIRQIIGLCTINGGTYKSSFGRTVLNGKRGYGAEFAINGGSFYGFNPACVSVWTGFDGNDYTNYYHQHDIIANGKTAVLEDGWYTVVDGAHNPKVKTESLCYPSAAEAIRAVVAMKDVANMGIITLLEDDELTATDALRAIENDFSFILGGHKLTLPESFETYETTLEGNRHVVKIKALVDLNYVAQIGETKYVTLIDAVDAAHAGDTITMLTDFTITGEEETNPWTVYEMPEGSTLDLKGKTLTTKFGYAVFVGKDFTIKNGTLTVPTPTDYALFIGNNYPNLETEVVPTTATVENVIVKDAGINLLGSARVTLRNNTVTVNPNRKYYAVAVNATAEAIIESGDYTGGRNNKDVWVAEGATVAISGGIFHKRAVEEAHCAAGYVPVDNDNETYTVGKGSVTLNPNTASIDVGDTVTLTATVTPENATNKTVTWTSSNEVVATVDENGKVTGMTPGTAIITATVGGVTAECTVTVPQRSSGSSGSPARYAITLEETENGDVTVSHKSAAKGSTVTITATPDEGYELDTLVVTDKNGDEIELTDKGDGKYTFKMPASKVTVDVSFKKTPPAIIFTDVYESDYYYDAVYWAVANGITNGTGGTSFSPLLDCSRAQVVTFLWRANGSPEPETTVNPFTDVSESEYYYKAVLWAVENGITKGTSDTTFSPDATVTRGQTVTFLYRNDGSPAVTGSAAFTDVAADAYYADAVQWAVTNGMTATTFGPDSDCTRAQIVTFLYRYFEK